MEIPFEVTARRDTGLWNAKIGIWLFLASEVMLFGGLFSGYVFLRIGVIDGLDNPWPTHVQNVWLGFTNTLVLIASSVFVVFSWVALKERSWKRFQIWMAAVVLCAFAFLGIKSYEYYGKFTHYGIELKDGSLIEAEILSGTDRLRFEASQATVDLNSGSAVFLSMLDGDLPKFKVPEGYQLPTVIQEKAPKWFLEGDSEGLVDFEKWVAKAKSLTAAAQKEQRTHPKEVAHRNSIIEAKMAKAAKKGETYDGDPLEKEDENIMKPAVQTKVTLVAAEPFTMHARTRKAVGHHASKGKIGDTEADVINFVDGSSVAGKLLGSAVVAKLSGIHEVDLQRVPLAEQRDAEVWKILGDEAAKEKFFDDQSKKLDKLREHYDKDGRVIPQKQLTSRAVNVHHVHLGHHGHDDHGAADGHHKDETAKRAPETGGAEDDAADHAGGEHASEEGEPTISIPFEQIARVSNHGPQYGTYYAIYFTMTGLHGLHVIGGAIVLTYFLLFGKKLFLKNPEHMANRVEVGGLFWHFVDLVWIFLFPIMYLL